MEWATKRRLLYAILAFLFIAIIFVFVFYKTLFPSPTCFDGKQNGFEAGLDCGGACSLICKSDTLPLTVSFATAIPVGDGVYDLVGIIENKNVTNAPKALPYTFTIFDTQGSQIFTEKGTTTIGVDDDKPLIIQNVYPRGVPYQTVLTLDQVDHYVKEETTSQKIKTIRTKEEKGDIQRLYVTAQNISREEFSNVPVQVIVYDTEDNAMAVGQTIIPFLEKEEEENIVFTWARSFPKDVASVRVYYDTSSH